MAPQPPHQTVGMSVPAGGGEAPRLLHTTRGQYVPVGWLPVTRGVRCRPRSAPDGSDQAADGSDAQMIARLYAWQAVLPPESCWTHLTGAAVRGWWLPPVPETLPVMAMDPSLRRRRRTGLRTVRRAPRQLIDVVDGLRVAAAADILVDCARDLAEVDLACLVASALFRGDCTRGDLLAAASGRGRGMRLLRRVTDRTDHRHESIWEVVLAELHHTCGFPIEPQHDVFDDVGAFVARGDLRLSGTRTLQEYDGDHHGERRQRRRDLQRTSDLHRAGWDRHGYVKDDVLHGAARIITNAEDALGWDHDPSRLRRWHSLLRESAFTPAGLERLRSRLVSGDNGVDEAEGETSGS